MNIIKLVLIKKVDKVSHLYGIICCRKNNGKSMFSTELKFFHKRSVKLFKNKNI
jgi:hypothetical protein